MNRYVRGINHNKLSLDDSIINTVVSILSSSLLLLLLLLYYSVYANNETIARQPSPNCRCYKYSGLILHTGTLLGPFLKAVQRLFIFLFVPFDRTKCLFISFHLPTVAAPLTTFLRV